MHLCWALFDWTLMLHTWWRLSVRREWVVQKCARDGQLLEYAIAKLACDFTLSWQRKLQRLRIGSWFNIVFCFHFYCDIEDYDSDCALREISYKETIIFQLQENNPTGLNFRLAIERFFMKRQCYLEKTALSWREWVTLPRRLTLGETALPWKDRFVLEKRHCFNVIISVFERQLCLGE